MLEDGSELLESMQPFIVKQTQAGLQKYGSMSTLSIQQHQLMLGIMWQNMILLSDK